MEILKGSLSGAKCLLYGLGKSNSALAKWLNTEGACVLVSDKKRSERELFEIAEESGCGEIKAVNYGEAVKADFLFRSPGISPFSSEIQSALNGGAVLTSDTELFFERAKGKIIGITGSDGKTTTTSVCGKILEKALEKTKSRVFVGGNIGTPLMSFLDNITENDISVLELSSFQLMTLRKSPHISAITNITENHLDYHKSMEEYIGAKCNIFNSDTCHELVISNTTLERLKKCKKEVKNAVFPPKIIKTSTEGTFSDIFLKDKTVFLFGKPVLGTELIKIPGMHNTQNYMTAIGLTKDYTSETDVQSVAETFGGAEHRMEFVKTVNGVSFYNSSIDSTPSRSAVTLGCFEKPLTVICGGYDKGLSYDALAQMLLKKADNVILTGANAEKINKSLLKYSGFGEKCRIYRENDFERAVILAANVTSENGKVILSPASASFDIFVDFEERGNKFKMTVNSI